MPEDLTLRIGPWVIAAFADAPCAIRDVLAAELAPAPATTAADLIVRFQPRWSPAGRVIRLGRHGGSDADRVFVCDRHGRRLAFGVTARVEDLGLRVEKDAASLSERPTLNPQPSTLNPQPSPERCNAPAEWLAEESFDPWALLGWVERWARARAWERGGAWVHGAAVAWKGEGWLFPAWGGTGKTDLLGAALRAGARYYADDWAAVGKERRLHPVARRLNLRDDNWAHWPEWRRVAGPAARVWATLAGTARWVPGRLGRRAGRAAAGRLRARIAAAELFSAAAAAEPVALRHVALLVSGDRPGTRIDPCSRAEIVTRIAACHAVENRMPIDLDAFLRYARPEGANACGGKERECESLVRCLDGASFCVVTLGPGSDPDALWRRLTDRGG